MTFNVVSVNGILPSVQYLEQHITYVAYSRLITTIGSYCVWSSDNAIISAVSLSFVFLMELRALRICMRKNIRNVSQHPSTETIQEVSRTMPSVGLTADYLLSVATETDHTRQLGNKAYHSLKAEL